MASINEKLNYITETKSLIKDKLNDLGSEINNETTFREYAEKIENLYNDWPKISDSGEVLALNGTKKGKITSILKGNTSQYTTQGKNISNWIQGVINSSGSFIDSSLAVCTDYISVNNGDSFTSQKNIAFSGTNDNMTCRMFDSNKTYLASVQALAYNNLTQTMTLNNANVAYVRFTQFRQDGLLVNNDYEIMVERGSTASNYEPFTGNQPSPNPDYPQDVQVVTGNNSIWINSKNFFNSDATPALNNLSDAGITSVINSDGTITVNGTKTANYKYIKYYISLPAGTYYFSGCPSDGTKYTYSSMIQTGDSNSPQIFDEGNGNTFTLTKPTTITYYPVRVGQNNVTFNNTVFKPIISKVPVTYNDFEKYQGLQTYQVNLPVKNLFDKDNPNIITNKYLDDSGVEIDNNTFSISDYIRVEPNTIYSSQPYENKNACICFYNSNKTFLSSVRLADVNPNFTTPNNCVYIRSSLFKADIDNIQIEKGSKVNRYTTFGTTPIELCKIEDYQDYIYKNIPGASDYSSDRDESAWYLKEKIGKAVYTTSTIQSYTNNTYATLNRPNNAVTGYDDDKTKVGYCNLGLWNINSQTWDSAITGLFMRAASTQWWLGFGAVKTLEEVNNFLNQNNAIVYYVLETPTYIKITDTTLIEQLNNLEKAYSYDTQTNISQINADRPFIITANALLKSSE